MQVDELESVVLTSALTMNLHGCPTMFHCDRWTCKESRTRTDHLLNSSTTDWICEPCALVSQERTASKQSQHHSIQQPLSQRNPHPMLTSGHQTQMNPTHTPAKAAATSCCFGWSSRTMSVWTARLNQMSACAAHQWPRSS